VICRNDVIFGVVAAGLMICPSSADAAAPITLDGWRYIAGPDRLHVFICEQADCVPGSRIACHFGPLETPVSPGLLRKEDAIAAELAGEHPRPVTTPLPALGPDRVGWSLLTEIADDGTKRYRAFSIVHNATAEFVLISSSSDKHVSQANLDRFKRALLETSK
jgi:hypothetical protein